MRPLVRTEIFRMRTAPEVKTAIREMAEKMEMTQTAYIEMLIERDLKESKNSNVNDVQQVR